MSQPAANLPRLVVGAPNGRSGKTTATLGLIGVFREAGMRVQPFKKGPDYIDPGWLSLAAGKQCRNLDAFLMAPDVIKRSFARNAGGADISVVEGAMGLFDGVDPAGSGSTGEIARILDAPVVLVVDATRMTRSAAPLVQGFMNFDRGVRVAAVILNRVARPRHESMLRTAVENYCGIPVLGSIPKEGSYSIPERHLGLVPAGERAELAGRVQEICREVAGFLDREGIVRLAGTAPAMAVPEITTGGDKPVLTQEDKPVVGVFRDRAFSFYYPENLEALEEAGALLVEINSLTDRSLPDVDALYIGGGFPEVFAPELAANSNLMESVRRGVEEGLPIYAECGGLMYLCRGLAREDGVHSMAGCLPLDMAMSEKPQGHGYEVVETDGSNPFFPAGTVIKGHEFHHSGPACEIDDFRTAFRVVRGTGINGKRDGIVYKNLLASYIHLHALAVPGWAPALVDRAVKHKIGRKFRQ